MNLLLAIKRYMDSLIKYGYYPKKKKPSLGKLEQMADLCMLGKYKKLSRYVPKDAPEERREELSKMMDTIKEICKNDR